MPSCEPRLTEPAGGVMHSVSLVANFSELHSAVSVISTLGRNAKRAVHNRAAACVAAGGGIFGNHL